jgi:hypothetical protein
MDRLAPLRPPTPSPARVELDRLGDEIAALSAHLDATPDDQPGSSANG